MRGKLILTFFAVILAARLFAQGDPLEQDLTALGRYSEANPVEKVYLQLDRKVYFPGDTIWFKAYVVAGVRNHLSNLSKVLYVELINGRDSIEKRLIMQLTDGQAHGDFSITYDAKPATYRVRAYTKWMCNAGDAYFYDEPVVVLGFNTAGIRQQQLPAQAKPLKKDSQKIDLQFFPEGGDMINNVRGRLAFKAIGPNGLGVDVSGKIVNNAGTEEATFASQHLGIGSLLFEPQHGETYFAKVTAADGEVQTFPLPVAKDAGFTLSVADGRDSLYVKVADYNMPDSGFYVVAQSDGRYYVSTGTRLNLKSFIIPVAKSLFPTGIVQFTLFSQTGKPLNERLVFVQTNDLVNLSLVPGKAVYKPGEAAQLNLQATDQLGVADIGHFSVSVVDEARVPSATNGGTGILAGLLLKSELGGYIEQPDDYFAGRDKQAEAAALDLLMLTQGYHRYNWSKIRAYQGFTPKYQAENGLFTIAGTVSSAAGTPVPAGPVMLVSTRPRLTMDTVTNDEGHFVFDNLDLPDTAKVIINASKSAGGDVQLSFDKPFSAPVKNVSGTASAQLTVNYNADEAIMAYQAWKNDSLKNVVHLMEVRVKGSKTPPFHADNREFLKNSANLNGPGAADQVITGEKFVHCTQLIDCLYTLIKGGVKWLDNKPYSLHTTTELTGPQRPMKFVVDGVVLDAATVYTSVTAQQIASVEVLRSLNYLTVYGEQGSAGLIVITTRRGGESGTGAAKHTGIAAYRFPQYYRAREFYTPKYRVAGGRPADERKTIFWAPDVTTDATGKTSLEFYNGHTPGTYRVIVEGIDENGRLGHSELTYKIE